MNYQKAIDLIVSLEGFHGKGFRNVLTPAIGYGTTRYPDGKWVRVGQRITRKRVMVILLQEVKENIEKIQKTVHPISLNENQVAALASFVSTEGIYDFKRSLLLKTIRNDPFDRYQIRSEFMRHNKVVVAFWKYQWKVLTLRRRKEVSVYFQRVNNQNSNR
jgi:lysozyme